MAERRRVGPVAARCRAAAQRVPVRLGMAADLLALRPDDVGALRGLGLGELPLLSFYRRTVPRLTVAWMLEFAEEQGLTALLRDRKDLRPEGVLAEAVARLGWDAGAPGARGVVRGILGCLAEVQLLAEHGGAFHWRGPQVVHDLGLPAEDALLARELFAGTLAWYRACLDGLPEVLRGKPPPLGFEPRHATLWDGFLGSPEQLLLRRVGLAAAGPAPGHVLDLGCGPGYGTACIAEAWPGAAITAIDLRPDAYPRVEELARRSAQALGVPLDLTLAKPWAGWGEPLPFPDQSFDAAFFGMNSGFVPPHRRTGTYAEVRRVLRPRGRFVVVSARLPSPAQPLASWEQRAKTWFEHAVEHSVAGFHGIPAPEDHLAAAAGAGLEAGPRPWRFAGLAAVFVAP